MHNLPPLISVLTLPLLGLSTLLWFSVRPPLGPAALSSADTGEMRQPRPAADDKASLTLLHCQYGCYERNRRRLRLARMAREKARWQENTREAVRLYNQAANDADPSAFAFTSLPRHLR